MVLIVLKLVADISLELNFILKLFSIKITREIILKDSMIPLSIKFKSSLNSFFRLSGTKLVLIKNSFIFSRIISILKALIPKYTLHNFFTKLKFINADKQNKK